MLTAIKRESGARVAILLTALVYATTHFFGRYRVAPANVNAGSGIDMLTYTLECSGSPCTSSIRSCACSRSACC